MRLCRQPVLPTLKPPAPSTWPFFVNTGSVLPSGEQLALAGAAAGGVTAARAALLAVWPEFREASERSNQQVGGSGAAGVQGVEGKQREGRGRHAGLSRASRCRWFLAIRPSVAHLRQLACLSRRCSRRWAGQT